jgi:hypothetical protein
MGEDAIQQGHGHKASAISTDVRDHAHDGQKSHHPSQIDRRPESECVRQYLARGSHDRDKAYL